MHDYAPLATTIVIGNQKGGVGKSTNACHLAAALGERGRMVLVIDLDPHAGATKHLGVRPDCYAGSLELLAAEDEVDSLAVSEGMPAGVELIPARTELAQLDQRISKYLDTTRLLEQPLRNARKTYDYIILDTPPAARSIATIAAYSEAEWILLSAFPHHLSIEGLTEAFRDINDVRRYRNHKLEVLGILLCCVDRRVKKSRERIEQLVASALPGRELDTSISQATVLPESSAMGKTVFQRPECRGHLVRRQYQRLAAELEYRMRRRPEFLSGTLDRLGFRITRQVTVLRCGAAIPPRKRAVAASWSARNRTARRPDATPSLCFEPIQRDRVGTRPRLMRCDHACTVIARAPASPVARTRPTRIHDPAGLGRLFHL